MSRYEGYDKKNILRLMHQKEKEIVRHDAEISSLEEDIQMLELELVRLEGEEE